MRRRTGRPFPSLGAAVGGLLATLLGLRATLLIAGSGGTLSVLWLLFSPIPGIRSLAPSPPDPADGEGPPVLSGAATDER